MSVHVHADMIVKDIEQNHRMGSPLDGTPTQSKDLLEIVRSKTFWNSLMLDMCNFRRLKINFIVDLCFQQNFSNNFSQITVIMHMPSIS